MDFMVIVKNSEINYKLDFIIDWAMKALLIVLVIWFITMLVRN